MLQSGEYAQLQYLLDTMPELKDDDESLQEMRAIFKDTQPLLLGNRSIPR